MIETRYHAPPTLTRCFTQAQINEAIKKNRLLSLSIKLPVKCNLKCLYCYGDIKYGDITYNELSGFLKQASQIGVSSLSIVGEGEPFMYKDKESGKDILDLIRDANKLGMSVIVFTNNTCIDEKSAKKISGLNVTIVCKLNSLKPNIQDYLSGSKGSFSRITAGLRFLERVGLASNKGSRLAIHTIICRQNYTEIPRMWLQWRRKNIIPYIQVLVPPENRNNIYFKELRVSKEQIRELFHMLSSIDREEFGFIWDQDATYPIAGLGCSVVKTGCCINGSAKVQMCAYVDEELGDLRKESLREIISSEKVQKIRNHDYNLGSTSNVYFYGCRALTFNMTKDRFQEDPYFWKNHGESSQL